MIRVWPLFLSILAVVLSSCAHAPQAGTRATADREARLLIEQLVSRFPPLLENGSWGTVAAVPPEDAARSADYQRVQAAFQRLKSMGFAAFPALVAASDDPRYSYSRIVAAWSNLSVGDACFEIIESQVEDDPGYKGRPAPNARLASHLPYLWRIRTDGQFKQWWAARRTRSLRDLQIECLQRTVAQEQAIGFVSDEQRRAVLGPSLARLKELGVTESAAGSSRAPATTRQEP